MKCLLTDVFKKLFNYIAYKVEFTLFHPSSV